MADARKQARRSGRAGLPPHPAPAGEGSEARSTAPDREGTPPPARPAPAAPSAGRIELPDSGLAEDILRRLAGGDAPAAPPAPPPEPPRIDLPPSGLASDILSHREASAAPRGPSEPSGETAGTPPAEAHDAHSLSFFAAPVKEQLAAVEATEHLATFFLEHEEYGVDVRQVQEIRRVTEITTVPRAPEFVRGVINLRGRILPVLDLKRKLGLGDVSLERATRIVVVRLHDRRLGLLVDGASQVLKVPVSRIEAPPEEVVDKGGHYIRGVAKLEDRLVILIDLERALASELHGTAPVAHARGAGTPEGVS